MGPGAPYRAAVVTTLEHPMSSTPRYLETVVKELEATISKIDDGDIAQLARVIAKANRVFATGSGRSGLMVRAFANRLLHLGIPVSVVGEISTPRIREGDLLLVSSGSGKSASPLGQARIAHECGAKVALVTASEQSPLRDIADAVLTIPAQTKASSQDASAQPMGSAFEQSTLIVYDALVLALMDLTNQTASDLKARHANLE